MRGAALGSEVKRRQETPKLVPGEIMTVPEVAEYLHAHPATIYKLIRKRAISAFRVGSDWRFQRFDLEEWIAQQERETDRAVAEEPTPVTAPKRAKRRPRTKAK